MVPPTSQNTVGISNQITLHISFGCLLGREYSRNACSVTIYIHI